MFGNKYSRIVLLLAVLCTIALIATGCGSKKESMTQKTFSSISEDKGLHMEVEQLANNARTNMTIVRKGDNLYASVEQAGQKVMIISDGKTITTLNPSTKTMVQEQVNDEYQKYLDQISSSTEDIMEAGKKGAGDYEEGTVKYDGEEYTTETFQDGEDEVVFGYRDGKLGYFAVTKDGQKQVLKINAMDSDVDEALFLVPEGYTAAKKDSDPAPSDSGSGASYKTIKAVGAAVGSAGTGTPTGDYVDVNNDDGDFAFEMDKAFSSENQKAHSYVFIEKGKKVPHFDVEPVAFGGDVDRYFDTLIGNLKQDQGNELVVDPIRTKLNVKGATVKGIEYVLKTGNNQMVCMFYIYPEGDDFYKFAGFYIKDDMTTPYALQHALETFRTDD